MYKIAEDEMVICPYNRSHVVRKLRIQQHIMKCKQKYPEVKLSCCLYNYTHRFIPEKMLDHYEICPHKGKVGSSSYCNDVSSNSSVKSEEDVFSSKPYPNSVHYMQGRQFGYTSSEMSFNDDSDEESEKTKSAEDDSSDEDDLEPLPLPKTASKAFVFGKEEQSEESSPRRGFGRGKNFLNYTPPKPPRPTDHLIPDLTDKGTDRVQKKHESKLQSITGAKEPGSLSSEIMDDSTLKSDNVIFEDEDNDNNDEKYDLLLKNLDTYVRI